MLVIEQLKGLGWIEMNFHPIIVHFPIALLLTSVFFDFLALLLKPQSALQTAAFYLLILGVLFGIAAGISGDSAAQALSESHHFHPDIQVHADFANGTIWLSILLLVSRAYFTIRGHFFSGWKAAYLILGLVTACLLSMTGYLGGRLVFEHGLGVKSASERARNP